MSKKILVVEDDPGISLSLKDEFEADGYTVYTADNGQKGWELAKEKRPDIIILDLMLPVMNGYDVCKRLRSEGDTTPIIILTAKDQEIDKVLGLELGADDYVTKPFSLRELQARVKAIFRRAEKRVKDLATFQFGQVELNFKRYEATRRGKKLKLTPLEFQILKLLIQRKGEVLSRDDFLDKIWGEDNILVTYRTVDSHISKIRKKIEDDSSRPKYILSIRSVGYKFVDPP